MTRSTVAALAALALGAGSASCAGPRLRREVAELAPVIAAARASGAERCAPVELARAEAHREFAALELDEGDVGRAEEEVALARAHALAAAARSPRERCALTRSLDRDGDGFSDAVDACPHQAEDRDGIDDADGCPEEDDDRDGLVGPADRCPDEPEDRDGHADDDGCPDLDNDADGVPDATDQCPEQAEDRDGNADDDGCPDCDDDRDGVLECPEPLDRCPGQAGRPEHGCPYAGLVVTDQRIELREPIRFAGRARVAPASNALLDELARALRESPTLRIRIEGHTDSEGRARANLRLSKARAEAVRKALIRRGIAKKRVVATGYGEERPVAENSTPEGRSQNRRVEIIIIGR